MKNIILLCSFVFIASLPVMALEKVLIKSCSTVIIFPGEDKKIDVKIDIYDVDNSFMAKIVQTSQGKTTSYEEQVKILKEEPVQAGLTLDFDHVEFLNFSEKIITHALILTEDPLLKDILSAGFDLRKIRSAKVYIVGIPGNMGLTAIVEAKDEFGNGLGSFLGGFLVSACKM